MSTLKLVVLCPFPTILPDFHNFMIYFAKKEKQKFPTILPNFYNPKTYFAKEKGDK